MSQCVPNWDLDDNPVSAKLSGRSLLYSTPPDVPVLDYEVAELTWENGQLAMHGLGQPRVSLPLPGQQQPTASATGNWDKLPRGTGTLESIVNQPAATTADLPSQAQRKHQLPPPSPLPTFDDLVPWFDRPGGGAASATMTMDALVPCAATATNPDHQKLQEQAIAMPPACMVGSCSGAAAALQEDGRRKRSRVVGGSVRVPAGEWSQYSVSGSAATAGRPEGADSQQMTVDTCERDGYTSMGSQDNTSSGTIPCTRATATATADDYDSVCHSRSQREAGNEDEKVKRNGKSSVSTKSRAAAIHNQSERKRRDKINQRMKTLQKLVPSSSKTDKASVLDEVIEYMKQLQAQVQMMSRMNMPSMMLPMAMQQQLQMSMMAPMGLGMGMGMGMAGVMDLNALTRPNIPGMPPNAPTPMLHPAAAAAPFMPLAAPWDGSSCNGDRLHPTSTAAAAAGAAVLGDPLSAFLACQSQPMTLDTYSRMAAIYQQLNQPPASSSKN